MQMRWVAELILSSLRRADILPWNRDSTLLCVDADRGGLKGREGEEDGGGPSSSGRRLNGSYQPIAAWLHQLCSSRYSASPPHHARRSSRMTWNESGTIMSNEWVMHPEWAPARRTCDSMWAVRGEAIFKTGLPQKPVTTGAFKGKDAQAQSIRQKQEIHGCAPSCRVMQQKFAFQTIQIKIYHHMYMST